MERTRALAATTGALICITSATPAAIAGQSLPLSVLASSSLQPAFDKIDGSPEFSFADSDLLGNSLRQGAHADVWAGAGAGQAKALAHERRIGKPVAFATTKLVLIVPRANRRHVHSVNSLKSSKVKLLLGDPALSFGNQSRALLTRLKLGAVAKRVVSPATSADQLITRVSGGRADAGIVFRADLTAAAKRRVRVIALPAKSHPTVTYEIAAVTLTSQPKAAAAFIRKVRSKAGQAALRRAGFGKP